MNWNHTGKCGKHNLSSMIDETFSCLVSLLIVSPPAADFHVETNLPVLSVYILLLFKKD